MISNLIPMINRYTVENILHESDTELDPRFPLYTYLIPDEDRNKLAVISCVYLVTIAMSVMTLSAICFDPSKIVKNSLIMGFSLGLTPIVNGKRKSCKIALIESVVFSMLAYLGLQLLGSWSIASLISVFLIQVLSVCYTYGVLTNMFRSSLIWHRA